LRLLVRLRVGIKLLDRLVVLGYSLRKLDITLRVLVTREHFCIIRKCGQSLVKRLVHLLCCALEEAPAAADEHGVARKYGFVFSVFEVKANAVLCVAWCVKGSDFDGTDFKGVVVGRRLVY